ncbi:MAG: LOG family protein [Hyphomonadaceae bacterium]|nr:LOG family protein [Hyphomonadaceae bacterium]
MAKKPVRTSARSKAAPSKAAPNLHVAPLAGGKGANTPQMDSPSYRLAALDEDFLLGDSMRGVRFLLEYAKVEEALDRWGVRSTVVVFGSARFGEKGPPDHKRWYSDARAFARIASEKGGALKHNQHPRDNVIATGGGPGIMEAANRGAADVGAPSIGYNIILPMEQEPNAYSTPDLTFRFHYFAMRKMHFAMRANALVVFPGGMGTMDELFEVLALRQTGKAPPIPIVLYDRAFWDDVLDFDAMAKHGVIDKRDLKMFSYAETPEQTWKLLVEGGVLTRWLQEQHTT